MLILIALTEFKAVEKRGFWRRVPRQFYKLLDPSIRPKCLLRTVQNFPYWSNVKCPPSSCRLTFHYSLCWQLTAKKPPRFTSNLIGWELKLLKPIESQDRSSQLSFSFTSKRMSYTLPSGTNRQYFRWIIMTNRFGQIWPDWGKMIIRVKCIQNFRPPRFKWKSLRDWGSNFCVVNFTIGWHVPSSQFTEEISNGVRRGQTTYRPAADVRNHRFQK